MESTSQNCPKLFGIWKPNRVLDLSKTLEINKKYYLDFARVEVYSKNPPYPTDVIMAEGLKPVREYNLEKLFDQDMLTLYIDAKGFVKERLRVLSEFNREFAIIDVDDNSLFSRVTSLNFNTGTELENIKKKHEVVNRVLDSLERALGYNFKMVKKVSMYENCLQKKWCINDGISIYVNPLETNLMTAGVQYLKVVSTKKGKKKDHKEMIDFCVNQINETTERLLPKQDGSKVEVGSNNDGTKWKIDFSSLVGIYPIRNIFGGK